MYPNNVAYPFGGVGQDTILLIELHYDNPELISGMKVLCSILCVLLYIAHSGKHLLL